MGTLNGGTGEARVLVVDDEDSITQLLSTALRYEGFDVETSSTGRGGLSAGRCTVLRRGSGVFGFRTDACADRPNRTPWSP